MTLQKRVIQAFTCRFGTSPAWVARAPGRVNLIGEHTDYNDGFVLPIAIERAVGVALRLRDDSQVVVHSLDFEETRSFSLADLRNEDAGWVEYVRGVAWTLQEAGYTLRGWEGVVAGDVPIGAGLSSSAALELATARAFAAVSDLPWEPKIMAKLGQRAENEWVGMQCGIMDQMISAAGEAGHALLIDCRSLATQPVPLPPDTVVLVLDTGTRRGLTDSAYNERRAQCEAAADFFGVSALRDVSMAEFEAQADQLDDIIRWRARHVVTENERALQAAEAMRRGDAVEVSRLMSASHASLRDDFEVSSDELNTMVQITRRQAGCYGARMTGAGFGGCAVALMAESAVDAAVPAIAAAYQGDTGLEPALYPTQAAAGASVMTLD